MGRFQFRGLSRTVEEDRNSSKGNVGSEKLVLLLAHW